MNKIVAKGKTPRRIVLRFRKADPEHNLLAAAQHYILSRGGSALIIGGIQVQRWPEDRAMQYRLAVCVTGNAPSSGEQR